MKKLIEATKVEFESACYRTPEYLAWHRLFKKEFTKFLNGLGIKIIQISKPNHFDASGFFQCEKGHIYYFSVSDLRWSKDKMLIRTAKSFDDFTGGQNQYASLQDCHKFEIDFRRICGIL